MLGFMRLFKNKYLYLVVILAVTLFYLGRCSKRSLVVVEPQKLNVDSVRVGIRKDLADVKQLQTKDSIQTKVVFKWRDRWREAKHDTVNAPCDSILPKIIIVCDSVIVNDSLLLAIKDSTIKKQGSVISSQSLLLRVDSVRAVVQSDSIKTLRREVKRQKWAKRGIIALWIAREVVGVYK